MSPGIMSELRTVSWAVVIGCVVLTSLLLWLLCRRD